MSQELGENAVVLHGDALDRETLTETNVDAAETSISAPVLAKREGCARAITLVTYRALRKAEALLVGPAQEEP